MFLCRKSEPRYRCDPFPLARWAMKEGVDVPIPLEPPVSGRRGVDPGRMDPTPAPLRRRPPDPRQRQKQTGRGPRVPRCWYLAPRSPRRSPSQRVQDLEIPPLGAPKNDHSHRERQGPTDLNPKDTWPQPPLTLGD